MALPAEPVGSFGMRYTRRMSYDAWLDKVDLLAAMVTGGLMHDDLDYDWRDAWTWGEHPGRAVNAAIRGVQIS